MRPRSFSSAGATGRGFSSASLGGNPPGRPRTNFDPGRATKARVAAQRWQQYARSQGYGGNDVFIPQDSGGRFARALAAQSRRDSRFPGEQQAAKQADIRPPSWER